jgi:hypothetical protein
MSDSDSEYDSALGSEIDSVYSAEADSPNYLSDYRWLDKLLDDVRMGIRYIILHLLTIRYTDSRTVRYPSISETMPNTLAIEINAGLNLIIDFNHKIFWT